MTSIYVGGYGAGNLGDDLILQSIITDDANAAIVAYGKPLIDERRPYINFETFFGDARPILANYDTLVFGGGGLFWSHDHIYEMLILALVAKNLGLRVELRRIGLHGMQYNLKAARQLLQIADYVSVREADSFDLAHQVLQISDVNIEHDYASNLLKKSVPTLSDKLIIGVNVGSTKFTDQPAFANHVSTIYAELARRYESKAQFQYVPFCIHMSEENQNDLHRADALFQASDGRIKLAQGVRSVKGLLNVCESTNLFVGERFHMHIIARSIGRSIIPLIHNEQTKYRAIADEYGDAPIFYESSQNFVIDEISRRIDACLSNYEIT
jgi:polysaccharide pyruvyl transferase WcaK-like protein